MRRSISWAYKENESAVLVLGDEDENVWLAFRNLTNVHVMHEGELNTYDILRHDYIVFTESTVPGEQAASPAAKKTAPAVKTDKSSEVSTEESN